MRRVYIVAGILLVVGLVLGLIVFLALGDFIFGALAAVALSLAAALIAGYALLTVYSNRYSLSNEEVTIDKGILNRVHRSVPLANVDNITVHRSISDRLLGMGDICIDSPGGTGYELVLSHVDIAVLDSIVSEMKEHMKTHRGGIKRNM